MTSPAMPPNTVELATPLPPEPVRAVHAARVLAGDEQPGHSVVQSGLNTTPPIM
jgi:hypothetical protein